jgi:hypothetical protein
MNRPIAQISRALPIGARFCQFHIRLFEHHLRLQILHHLRCDALVQLTNGGGADVSRRLVQQFAFDRQNIALELVAGAIRDKLFGNRGIGSGNVESVHRIKGHMRE